MTNSPIERFAAIAAKIVREIDTTNSAAMPFPWFCKDIFRDRDVQWAGYVGEIWQQKQALAFGINLEFIPAWRKVFPKIKGNLDYFSNYLQGFQNLEWHWMARPGGIAKNPKVRYLSPKIRTCDVDYSKWFTELDDILEKRWKWSSSTPIRPQIQVMRQIGLPAQLTDEELIKQNIDQTVVDLQPFVDFFWR